MKTSFDEILEDRFLTKVVDETLKHFHYRIQNKAQIGFYISERVHTEEAPEHLFHALVQLTCFLSDYRLNSGKVYEITEGIAPMLLHTKLDINTDFFKLPSNNIVLLVPPSTLHDYYDRELGTCLVNLTKELIPVAGKDGLPTIIEGSRDVLNIGAVLRGHPQMVTPVKVPLTMGELLSDGFEEFIKKTRRFFDPQNIKQMQEINERQHLFGDIGGEWNAKDEDISRHIFQFVVNSLLYITSPDPDLREEISGVKSFQRKLSSAETEEKREKLRERIRNESTVNRYVIGGNVKLTEEEKLLYSSVRKGGKHQVRYLVGGHWRMQWVGHRDNAIQTPVWVRPHFRGPEIATLVKSIGMLKGDKRPEAGVPAETKLVA